MYFIPKNFSERMIEMHGDKGRIWLDALPSMLDNFAQRWSLTLHSPFELSYNYVCPATCANGSETVLKLGYPDRELLSEMHALKIFDGRGIVKLLEADFIEQVFLIERIRPGKELVTIKNDEERTRIAAQVMQLLWRQVADNHPLLSVENWTSGLRELRPFFSGTTGPFPEYLVDVAENIFADFIPSQGERVLLHGDLHHWNILSSTRQPWLALDPKGVIGEREYEVGALLRNPWGEIHNISNLKEIQSRRIDILAETLGFDRQRMLGWGVAQAILSAWWSVEDHGSGWEGAVHVAKVLYELLERKELS